MNAHNKTPLVCHSPTGGSGTAVVVVSEYTLNPRESFRAEVATTNGRQIVRLSRWKNTPAGPRRTGQVFEFGVHRTAGVAKLVRDVEQLLHGGGAA